VEDTAERTRKALAMGEPEQSEPAALAIQVESSGVCWEFLVATPFGLLVVFGGLGALWLHTSGFAIVFAIGTLVFGTAVLVSCAYSVWGTCSVAFEDGACVVTHRLWRWRWTWRFFVSQIRHVFVYDSLRPLMFFPGSCGPHVRVSLQRSERAVPIASGLHAPRETLERIQAMLRPPP
jgi:hypothetical protein